MNRRRYFDEIARRRNSEEEISKRKKSSRSIEDAWREKPREMRKLGSRGGASAMMRILGEKSGGECRGSGPGKTFETGVGRRRVEKGCAPEEKGRR
jgi:hypothetical protein